MELIQLKKDLLAHMLARNVIRTAESPDKFFKFKSGRLSPNFFNLGILNSGKDLSLLSKSLAQFTLEMQKQGKLSSFQHVFGPAYKGIPLATALGIGLNELGLDVGVMYDRKEEKGHGDPSADKIIMGSHAFKPGDSILMVDDVVTTGGTKVDALEKLKLLGEHKLAGLVLIVDRQEKMGGIGTAEDPIGEKSAVESLQEAGIKTFSLLNAQDVFDACKPMISDSVKQSWVEYYDKYGAVRLMG